MPLNTQADLRETLGWFQLSSPAAAMIMSHMNGFAQEASGQSHRERAVDCPGEESSLIRSPHCSTQMERIQHYQEELKKRREADSRGKLAIDPSASLKLKKLSQNPKVGIDNPTFEGKEKATEDPQDSQDPADGELGEGGE